MKTEDIRKYVRDRYAGIVKQGGSCCDPSACCSAGETAEKVSGRIGYSEEEMKSVPGGSNLGLGCGNPTALASLRVGETVLDLGSGAGFDCFLAADQVGLGGQVIGVDMTPEMIQKARENAARTPKRATTKTSNSGWGRSSIYRRQTTPWTSSSPTV